MIVMDKLSTPEKRVKKTRYNFALLEVGQTLRIYTCIIPTVKQAYFIARKKHNVICSYFVDYENSFIEFKRIS